jgi:hypothetical protein
MGELTFTFPKFGEIPTAALKGNAVDFDGPVSSLTPSFFTTAAPADDDMTGGCIIWQPRVFLNGTATRTETDGFSLSISQAITAIPDGSKPTGIGGFLDTGGRDSGISVQGKLRVRLDSDIVAGFDTADVFHMLIANDPAAGVSTGAAAYWEMARCQFIDRPVPVSLDGGRAGYELSWKALLGTDTPSSSSAQDVDLARSPLRFGLT